MDHVPALSQLRAREIVWVDWLRAEGEKVFIRAPGKSVEGLSPSDNFPTEELGFAVRRGVGDKNFAGERGDKAVALVGGILIRAADGVRKLRQQKQSAFLERLAELWRHSFGQSARGADDDGVRTPQQDAETLPLHRGMKPADDCHSRSAQFLCEVVGLQDKITGTFNRAEQRQRLLLQDVEIAQGGDCLWRVLAEMSGKLGRVARIGSF